MCAFVESQDGDFLPDPNELAYTDEEMAHALEMRNLPQDHPKDRPDQCPHTPAHTDLHECLENICWYFRYRTQIEASLKARSRRGTA